MLDPRLFKFLFFMEEIVDILNDEFKIIGQIEKRTAHQHGNLHACVVAEYIDSDGNWTLVKQADDRQDSGQFVSPVGGHVQSGEEYEDALRREAEEEIGAVDFKFKHIGQTVFNREIIGRKENHLFVVYEIYSDKTPKLNHESVSFKKFSQKNLSSQLANNPQKFGAAFHHVVKNIYPHLLNE